MRVGGEVYAELSRSNSDSRHSFITSFLPLFCLKLNPENYHASIMSASGISALNLAIWLLFGGIIGLTIHLFDPHKIRGGAFSSLFMGMLGAMLGGLFAAVFSSESFISLNTPGLMIAISGGVLTSFLARFMLNEGKYTKRKMKRGLA